MNAYVLSLFLHIVGALGLFAAIGLEWVVLFQARRASSVDQVRMYLQLARGSSRLGMPSMIVLLLSGGYMGMTVWHGVAWLLISLVALVLLVIIVLAFVAPRLRAIGQTMAATAGVFTPALAQQLQARPLWIALQTRLAIALGIVYLMTVKPDLVSSLIAMTVFVVVGLITGLLVSGYSANTLAAEH